jgi:hypothetical protein
MEHFTKKVLLPLIALVLSAVPSSAQNTIDIFHGTTLDQVQSVVAGIQNVGNQLNQAGPGLYVSFDFDTAWARAMQVATQNIKAGLTGPATIPYVLEGVITDGATTGNFFVMQGQNLSNLAMGEIGNDVAFSQEVQTALLQFDALEIIGTESNLTQGFMVLHESANPFVGWWNAPAQDLSIVASQSDLAKALNSAQAGLSRSSNIIAAQGDALSPGTAQTLANAGIQAVQNCGFYCQASAVLAASWANLKIGLQMTGESIADGATQTANFLFSGGMGGVSGAAATLGGVMICDANFDNLCSNNIATSLNFLLFGPANDTGPTLVSQTFNPYTGAMERDYSDGTTTWTWNNGIVSGISGSGIGFLQDPVTGEVGSFTTLDGRDPRSSQILQVNFQDRTLYLTQAGYSLTLQDAQDAVAAINALNPSIYQYPALFQIPAVVPVLDPNGKPSPVPQPDSSGTYTLTGTTPGGAQYATTVQKDSSGNVVSEFTTVIGPNYTTSKNDVTGTSLTIQRNPDGSTSIFNCIQKGTVCATDSGIVNFDDGWGGKNPYDASNQTFSLTMPGGGGGGGPLMNAPGDPTVGIGGCTELGC